MSDTVAPKNLLGGRTRSHTQRTQPKERRSDSAELVGREFTQITTRHPIDDVRIQQAFLLVYSRVSLRCVTLCGRAASGPSLVILFCS